MKKCSKCRKEKPFDSFRQRSASKDGLLSICKPCDAKGKAWRAANRERHIANAVAWREANKERALATEKAWREANKERKAASGKAWREANAERNAARLKAWQEANPGRTAAHARRRRARLRGVVTEADLPSDADLIAATAGICPHCDEAPQNWDIDHIWPISKGGPHIRENLQAICTTCNRSKSTRLPDQEYPYPPWWDYDVVQTCVDIALDGDEADLL